MKIYIGIILFFLTVASFAQTPESIEKKLLASFTQIEKWASAHDFNDSISPFDSVFYYNDVFAADLLKYTSGNAATIRYNFKKLKAEGLVIEESEDRLFRIYSWNTLIGGTMRFYQNVLQYKANNKVYAKTVNHEEGDGGVCYLKVYTLNAGSKAYYLAVNQAVFATSDLYQSVKVFSIDGDLLNDNVKLIKTTSGLQNELGFEFNFFTVDTKKKPLDKLINFNKQKKTLTIPLVKEDLTVTDKVITYTFTGKYFEKLKK